MKGAFKRTEAFEMWIWRRMLKVFWMKHKKNDKVLRTVRTIRELMDTLRSRQKRWWEPCWKVDWKGEEKRKAKRNATKLATGDKWWEHGLFTNHEAGTGAGKMVSTANENLPIGQNTKAAAFNQLDQYASSSGNN